MIPVAALETVQILGAEPREILAGVTDGSPAQTKSLPGQTDQVVTLLVNPDEQLWPPARVRVRGRECRVLGSQSVPWAGVGALITCEQVNPDLPDLVRISRRTKDELDVSTGRIQHVDEPVWSGPAHIVTGVPWVVESGGEETALDKATITLPNEAPYESGFVLRVTDARTPALVDVELTLMGEVLDSASDLYRVVGYRKGD